MAFPASPWAPCLHLLPWSLKTSRWGLPGASTPPLSLGQLSVLRPLAGPQGRRDPGRHPRSVLAPPTGSRRSRDGQRRGSPPSRSPHPRGDISPPASSKSLLGPVPNTEMAVFPKFHPHPHPGSEATLARSATPMGETPSPSALPGRPGPLRLSRVHMPTRPPTACAVYPLALLRWSSLGRHPLSLAICHG